MDNQVSLPYLKTCGHDTTSTVFNLQCINMANGGKTEPFKPITGT